MNVMSGDVVEVDLEDGPVTALILLATADAVIIDALDGSTPFVVAPADLVHARVFHGDDVDEIAA